MSYAGCGKLFRGNPENERKVKQMHDEHDSRPFPSSQKGPRIETGVGDLADMNQNKGVLDSGPKVWHNPEDSGRYERKDYRTPERKREKSTVL